MLLVLTSCRAKALACFAIVTAGLLCPAAVGAEPGRANESNAAYVAWSYSDAANTEDRLTYTSGTNGDVLDVHGNSYEGFTFRSKGKIQPGPGCKQGSDDTRAVCTPYIGAKGHQLELHMSPQSDSVYLDTDKVRGSIEVFLFDGKDTIVVSKWTVTNGTGIHISGGPGDDTLVSFAERSKWGGFSELMGGPGADYMCGGKSVVVSYGESIFGLPYSYTHPAGVVVTLDGKANDGWPGENDNVCSTVGHIIGSWWRDWLIVYDETPSGIALSGGDGNDVLQGSNQDDYLSGGRGQDWLEGYAGADSFVGDNWGQNEWDTCDTGPEDLEVNSCDTIY